MSRDVGGRGEEKGLSRKRRGSWGERERERAKSGAMVVFIARRVRLLWGCVRARRPRRSLRLCARSDGNATLSARKMRVVCECICICIERGYAGGVAAMEEAAMRNEEGIIDGPSVIEVCLDTH